MKMIVLADLIEDQRARFIEKKLGIPRDIQFSKWLFHKQIIVISGIRRCGKSTLLRQFADQIDDFHYLNFDDERLFGFEVQDFENLMLCFHKRSGTKTILLDEIQNIPGWERFVRRIHDEGFKVILTGSNAQLLSAELGTHLTGRHMRQELFPFSFAEYLAYRDISAIGRTTKHKALLSSAFDDFVRFGGFPEYLESDSLELLQQTYEDILFRDIVTRYGIRDVKGFQGLAHYFFTNFTSEMNYNRLCTVLGFSSATTVRKYIGYLEQSYLLFEIKRYDYSLKKQHVSGKKVYVIDSALRGAIAFSFSADRGRYLENIVFMELRRKGCELYFLREKNECDFIAFKKGAPPLVIQICAELTAENKQRELRGLTEALTKIPASSGLILTEHQTDEELLPTGDHVPILPIWRWLLEN